MTQNNSRTYKDCAVLASKIAALIALSLLALWFSFSGIAGVLFDGLPTEALFEALPSIFNDLVVPRLGWAFADFLAVFCVVFLITAGKHAWSKRSSRSQV